MLKRKFSNGGPSLSEPFVIRNMVGWRGESTVTLIANGNGVDWIKKARIKALEEAQLIPVARIAPQKPPQKRSRSRTWKKKIKLPYRSSMFYRDYHNPNVRNRDHADAKEFRRDYRMPWSEVRKLVDMFVQNKWVALDRRTSKTSWTVGSRVCPPEIKILGTLYWLGEGCTFRTIRNLSNRVLSRTSFTNFAKKFCLYVATYLVDSSPQKRDRVARDKQGLRARWLSGCLWQHRWRPDRLGGVSVRVPGILHRQGGVPHLGVQRDS